MLENKNQMARIYLALGSNVGDRSGNIQKALKLLSAGIGSMKIAPIYESRAVGYENQPAFLNTAIEGVTDLKPKELLVFAKDIESKLGRIKRFKWGPREIDIDILFYGDMTVSDGGLKIPHPRLIDRDFVLKPLCDLNPNFVHPELKKTIRELFANLPSEKTSIIKKICRGFSPYV